MDDFFDSLIYIIITLAAFAISLLGKKKKPAKRSPAEVTGEEHPKREQTSFLSDFERFFDDQHEESDDNEQVEPSFVGDNDPQNRANDNQIRQEILDSVPEQADNNKEKMPYSMDPADAGEGYSEPIKDEDLTMKEDEEP